MYDVTIIGAGIVGLATAYQLLERRPDLKICMLEKENGVARHQTGHNSGVIHSGIYYKPGGTRAVHCQRGYKLMLEFAEKQGIPYDICGKIIVATNAAEQAKLDEILQRGIANGMKELRKVGREELLEIEPYAKGGVEAIWVPQAGIINYKKVAEKYLEIVEQRGATAFFGAKVQQIIQGDVECVVISQSAEARSKIVVNCAGLYSDKVANMTVSHHAYRQASRSIQILPFRGEYYELIPEKQYLVRNLIYPTPNPKFPFLGVHFTRMIEGGIEAGPNAVLAFKREGYSRWDFDRKEFFETLSFPGFRKIAAKYWRDGLEEMRRSYFKSAFVKSLQKLVPEIQSEDLRPGGAGVRAMACDAEGNIIDDFLIFEDKNIINVCNAPSPAATASLAIGETIAQKVLRRLNEK
ncbi:MAG: L-2-hydroxyglutarate oxidase [Saprospiraceae bacterium]|nr:L-2-hydroxyglutarate oxidase [Saprospiraceae bacterium]